MELYKIKLRELLQHLQGVPEGTDIIFGNGNLEFYRTKWRGDNLLQIEFSQNTTDVDPLPKEDDPKP
jgi:hypothetical protein